MKRPKLSALDASLKMEIKKEKFVLIILGGLLLVNFFAWSVVCDLNRFKFLEVNFFDVGQGDAIFIQTPQRHQVLIDGGPGSAVLEKLAKEMPFWDRTIDLVILTHPEKDHMAGFTDVLKRYKVENILWTGILKDTPEFKEWQRLIGKEGTEVRIAQSGQIIIFPINEKEEIRIDVLYPLEKLEVKEMENSNDTSIVSRMIFGEKSFLFTGDATKSTEKKLLERETNIKSDVLKVAHHGSKTSSGEDFIKKVLPEIAVIEVGKNNSYGHPHQETLATLEKYGTTIFRTDINDVKILCDSQSLKLK